MTDDLLLFDVTFEGRKTAFCVENEADVIQKQHTHGRFYELDALTFHRQLIPFKGVVIDVGANVGNHTMFYARHTKAVAVYPLEPNPAARSILLTTIAENDAKNVDTSRVNFGAGAEAAMLSIKPVPGHNLGAATLDTGAAGDIAVETLDYLFTDVTPNFVKIDVEGMEIDVLQGAADLFRRARPALAIEVDNKNIGHFWKWADAAQYHVINAFKAHRPNINYVCISKR